MDHEPLGVADRPPPAQPYHEQVQAWLQWFGLGRLVASAVSVVVVCLGAFWLVRAPTPPAEAVLPRVSNAEAPSSTLAVPARDPGAGARAANSRLVIVHVAGAVAEAGVYQLSAEARVDDAIEAAGGAVADANLDGVNLAAVLVDGTRIYVPAEGEPAPALDPVSSAPDVLAGPIDLNRADATVLDTLPGVGPATAAAIVAERERNGPFLGVDDLERVPGIGPAKLALLREWVTT